jgi:hypothetical protein
MTFKQGVVYSIVVLLVVGYGKSIYKKVYTPMKDQEEYAKTHDIKLKDLKSKGTLETLEYFNKKKESDEIYFINLNAKLSQEEKTRQITKLKKMYQETYDYIREDLQKELKIKQIKLNKYLNSEEYRKEQIRIQSN